MLVLSVSIPVNSHAQTVRGRLVHAETGTGIGGAMITLVDRHGGTADRTLTANTGLFQLSAPSGRYRLRADRIGYASTHSEYFDLQAREVMDIERVLDRDGRMVLSEERSLNRSFLLAPYVSRPADSLTAEGFAHIAPDTSVYWAPDAEVLLSDPFLDTHCFRLRTNVHHAPGLIGLAFEPVSWRAVPDIGGTLWSARPPAR